MLLVLYVLTLVAVRLRQGVFLPSTTAVPKTLPKVTLVKTTVGPEVFSVTVGLTHRESSLVKVTVREFLDALTVFQALQKVAFVPIPVDPKMNASPIGFVEFPLAYVAISFGPVPDPRAMLEPTDPLSLVELAIGPLVTPQPFWFAVDVVACVDTAIVELLVALAVLEVGFPLSLVPATIVIEHDAFAMTFVVGELAVECGVSILFEFEVGGRGECLYIDEVGEGRVVFELLQDGFVGEQGTALEGQLLEGRLFLVDWFVTQH